MKSSIILLLIIATFLILRNNSQNIVKIHNYSNTYELFLKGSEEEVIKFLNSQNGIIRIDSFYALIRNDRVALLDKILSNYQINPDFGSDRLLTTPLLFASEMLNVEAVNVLINHKSNVNLTDEYGNSALIIAMMQDSRISNSDIEKQRSISKNLIDAGAEINVKNSLGITPLESAIRNNDMHSVSYFVEKGVDIFYLSKDGSTYLNDCQSVECLYYFVNKGIDINHTNQDGETVLHFSVFIPSDDITKVEALLELGASICMESKQGKNILWYAEVANINFDFNNNEKYFDHQRGKNKNTGVYKFLSQKYYEECQK